MLGFQGQASAAQQQLDQTALLDQAAAQLKLRQPIVQRVASDGSPIQASTQPLMEELMEMVAQSTDIARAILSQLNSARERIFGEASASASANGSASALQQGAKPAAAPPHANRMRDSMGELHALLLMSASAAQSLNTRL